MTLPGVIAPDSSVPIACSLTAGAVGDRESEWRELLSRALISRAPAPGGVRIELRPLPGVRRELQRLIAAERDCCPFMAMSVDTTAAQTRASRDRAGTRGSDRRAVVRGTPRMTLPRPRIVVATSGSGASRKATETAARLASAFEAELTIVHVVPAVEYRVGRLASTLPIARQLDDPYASLVLLDARRLAWAKGATARPVLIAGEAPQAVVAVAGRLVADLLVLGARRRRWPTSARAATRRWIEAHAPCPVLVVPAEELSPTPVVSEPIPVASWARNELAFCCCGDESRGCRCYDAV